MSDGLGNSLITAVSLCAAHLLLEILSDNFWDIRLRCGVAADNWLSSTVELVNASGLRQKYHLFTGALVCGLVLRLEYHQFALIIWCRQTSTSSDDFIVVLALFLIDFVSVQNVRVVTWNYCRRRVDCSRHFCFCCFTLYYNMLALRSVLWWWRGFVGNLVHVTEKFASFSKWLQFIRSKLYLRGAAHKIQSG